MGRGGWDDIFLVARVVERKMRGSRRKEKEPKESG